MSMTSPSKNRFPYTPFTTPSILHSHFVVKAKKTQTHHNISSPRLLLQAYLSPLLRPFMDSPLPLPLPHPHPPPTNSNTYSTVDTSRPFRSVKEAVVLFGERFLANEIYAKMGKPPPPPLPLNALPEWSIVPHSSYTTNNDNDNGNEPGVADMLKKLQAELEDTKRELNVLKEKETETDIALASLHAELHKNMSKMAKVEADVAGKAVSSRGLLEYNRKESEICAASSRELLLEYNRGESETHVERNDGIEYYSSFLAKLLSLREEEEKQKMKKMKKKPIVPLLVNMFSRKKRTASAIDDYFNSSSFK